MDSTELKNNLRILRAKLDITQEDLARKVGVTRKTINTIENSVYIPSALLAIKIAKAFNEPFENVFYVE
jgi:putative transcriptional regulator